MIHILITLPARMKHETYLDFGMGRAKQHAPLGENVG